MIRRELKEEILKRKMETVVIENDMEIKELIHDTFFKATFTREENVLLYMIKDFLDIRERYDKPIIMVGFEIHAPRKNAKTNRCDILIRLSDESYIHIEMNNSKSNNVISRNIIQVSRIYGNLRKWC